MLKDLNVAQRFGLLPVVHYVQCDTEGNQHDIPAGYYGVEIEAENSQQLKSSSFDVFKKFWETKIDGSLRNNGTEFVSHVLSHTAIVPAFNALFKSMDTSKLSFSQRTSVHVHVNAKDMNARNLKSFILLSAILEPALYSFCSMFRYGNIFCVPMAETLIFAQVNKLFSTEHGKDIPQLSAEHFKYSGLNFTCLHDKGTLEFRHMPGNLNLIKLINWIKIIGGIKACAMTFSAEDVLNIFFKRKSNKEFIKKVFWDSCPLQTLPELNSLILKGSDSILELYSQQTIEDVLEKIDLKKSTFSKWMQEKISKKVEAVAAKKVKVHAGFGT